MLTLQRGHLEATGRGLVAIAGQGLLVQIEVEDGESFTVHPRSAILMAIALDACL